MEQQQQHQEVQDIEINPKTTMYLEGLSQQAATLFEQATIYKQKHMNAKTSFSKQLYSKKLAKTVKKLDSIMSLFSAIEQRSKKHIPSAENEV